MKALIILNMILFFAAAAAILILILYVKESEKEEAELQLTIKKLQVDYLAEKAKVDELKAQITGPNDDSDAVVNNMLQNAAGKSKSNSRRR